MLFDCPLLRKRHVNDPPAGIIALLFRFGGCDCKMESPWT